MLGFLETRNHAKWVEALNNPRYFVWLRPLNIPDKALNPGSKLYHEQKVRGRKRPTSGCLIRTKEAERRRNRVVCEHLPPNTVIGFNSDLGTSMRRTPDVGFPLQRVAAKDAKILHVCQTIAPKP